MIEYPDAQIVPYGADKLTAAAVQSGVRRSRLPAPTSTIRVKSVSCGGGHTCAITKTGLYGVGVMTLCHRIGREEMDSQHSGHL